MKKILTIFFILLSLFLIIYGLFLLYYHRYENCTISRITLTSSDGIKLNAFLYLPKKYPVKPGSGVVCAHGFSASSKNLETGLSLELAKRGFVVVAFDFRGHGNSQGGLERLYDILYRKRLAGDIDAAVSYLKTLPEVDKTKIALVGHSMGGFSSTCAGFYNPDIIATVSIGALPLHSPFLNAEKPKNYLMAIGKYDNLFPESMGEKTIAQATGGKVSSRNIFYGDFSKGTARELYYSPLSDHLREVVDPLITTKTIEWLENSFYGKLISPIQVDFSNRVRGFDLALLGMFIGFFPFVSLSRKLFFRNSEAKKEAIPKIIYIFMILYFLMWLGSLLFIKITPGLFSWFPLAFVNIILAMVYLPAVLLFIIYLIMRKWLAAKIVPKQDKAILSGISFGIFCWIYIFALVNIIVTNSFLDFSPTAREIGIIIALLLLFIPVFAIDEFWLRRKVQSTLIGYRKRGYWKTLIFILLVRIIYCAVGLFFLSYAFHYLDTLLVLTGILLLCAAFSTWIYEKTENIYASVTFNALLTAWILAMVFPFL